MAISSSCTTRRLSPASNRSSSFAPTKPGASPNPEDPIYKAVSRKLEEKAPDVFSFLQAFTITTEDQFEMLPPVEIDGDDPAAVAAKWVADHESTWQAWLG